MVKPEDILQHVGRRVVLELAPQATGGPVITGRIVGALRAADGLVVSVEPDGGVPAPRVTYHYTPYRLYCPGASGLLAGGRVWRGRARAGGCS